MNVWLEPEECLGDFKSSLILTKFKIKMRKNQIFIGYMQK